AESSRGVEAGLRGGFEDWSFSLSAYDNRYSDFIDSVMVGNVNGIMLFQDANVGKARIRGLELTLGRALGERWSWRGALSWMRGDDEVNDVPLNGADPFTAVTGLR